MPAAVVAVLVCVAVGAVVGMSGGSRYFWR